MTPRSILIGLAGVAIIAFATPYSDLVMRGTWIGLTSFPISSFVLMLFLVGAVNSLLRKLGRGLAPGELLVAYCMMLVAAGVPSFGLTGLLIPYMAGPLYFANPENKWESILLPNLPKWLHPSADAATGLYEGVAPGAPIPWAEWVGPLAAWSVLVIGVYAVFFGLSSLLRSRWVDDEKLVFPLVQLPLGLTEYGEARRALPDMLYNPTLWCFFAVPFVLHAINGLHFYFPVVPTVNVHMISLDSYLRERPWTAMSPLWLRFLFSIIGLSYLLPAEVSFSLWFFFFYFVIQQVIGSAAGFPMPAVQAYPTRKFVAHQMIGGILMYFVAGLQAARPRLVEMWEALRSADPKARGAGRGEALSTRAALALMAIGLAVIACWGAAAGATGGLTLLIFGLYFVLHTVAVRLVCEGGMLYVQHPFRPFNMMLSAAGSHALGPKPLAILGLFDHLFMLDNRSPLMPGILQSLRLSDDARVPRRSLAASLAGSVLLSMALSYVAYLRLMYVHGGTALNTWFTTYYSKNLYGTWVTYLISNGERAAPLDFVTMLAGALSMWGLTFMHRTHLWWPLHPVGYLMGASWPMINFWFPVFLGWFIKTTILRFGGHKIYQKLVPGFLGLILGEFSAAGVWVLIDVLTGKRGHEIFSF